MKGTRSYTKKLTQLQGKFMDHGALGLFVGTIAYGVCFVLLLRAKFRGD